MNAFVTPASTIERNERMAGDRLVSVATFVAQPLLRVALALPFFRSGLTRWDGVLSLSDGTLFLFEEQFKLNILGRTYDLPVPDTLALVTALAEIILPILLVLGLATRPAALGLLVMTAVIQLVVPEGWANFHLYWAAMATAIVALGGGRLSIDHLIGMWRGARRLEPVA